MKIIEVTPKNAIKESFFCIKDTKRHGFKNKLSWFKQRHNEGMRIKILKTDDDKMVGFIEYVPAKNAWRPIEADNYMFIHCIYIYSKKQRGLGNGAMLIADAEKEAKALNLDGVCVMTSSGGWMANKTLFEKNGFHQIETKDRFELLAKTWNNNKPKPRLLDWHSQQIKYKGWHLTYSDQCPWNEKSAEAILNVALDHEIDLNISKIRTIKDAKAAPSGFGTFNLLRDGRLLEDHYISHTRFRNILRKELNKKA